jgi:hypothetical protein
MKLRNLLVGFVLAMMVLFAGISSTTASPAPIAVFDCV